MNSLFLCALFVPAWVMRLCFCRFYLSLLGLPRDTMLTIFVLIFHFRNIMAVRGKRNLCYVDIGCYIASQFVCGWFWRVWVAKLYFTGYSIFWSGFPCGAVLLTSLLLTFQLRNFMAVRCYRNLCYVDIGCLWLVLAGMGCQIVFYWLPPVPPTPRVALYS